MTEHGIFQDQSEWRCHVGFTVMIAFFFRTQAVRQLNLNAFPWRSAASHGGRYGDTAYGYLVPVAAIPGLVSVQFPGYWQALLFGHWQYLNAMRCSEKHIGDLAQRICAEIIELGTAPVTGNVTVCTDREQQLKGIDLIADGHTVQVKSDFEAGPVELGGTGNLYIQAEERNPEGLR